MKRRRPNGKPGGEDGKHDSAGVSDDPAQSRSTSDLISSQYHFPVLWPELESEFRANCVRNRFGMVAHEGFGLGFDHNASESLGSAVTDDDAA